MIRGVTWTDIQSVWNPSGPSEVPYSATGQDFFPVSYSKPALKDPKIEAKQKVLKINPIIIYHNDAFAFSFQLKRILDSQILG